MDDEIPPEQQKDYDEFMGHVQRLTKDICATCEGENFHVGFCVLGRIIIMMSEFYDDEQAVRTIGEGLIQIADAKKKSHS